MDISDFNESVKILEAAKHLFREEKDYTTAYVGIAAAVLGALAAYIPNMLLARHQRMTLAESTAYQLHAELQAIFRQASKRRYGDVLQNIVDTLKKNPGARGTLKVQFPEDRFHVYKANLCNIGLLPPALQSDIVMLYQTFESLVQDLKPGGVLNSPNAGFVEFSEVHELYKQAESLFKEVTEQLTKLYPKLAKATP